MKKYVYLLAILGLLGGCKNEENNQRTTVSVEEEHPGKALMELNCNACHSPTAGKNDRIAPPMIAVKRHYLEQGMSKDVFQAAILKWIENPIEEHTKMPGAIKKFGIMAKVDYPKKTINQIADYLYTNKIEKPDWFDEHYQKNKGKYEIASENGLPSYAEIGMKYAISTKSQLGKNLMGAIQSRGTEEAVSFCNTRAISITDSMSVVNNATIKRISDKARNPKNKANVEELRYIASFKELLANEKEIKPIVEEGEESVRFYFPIKTNAMCLQCHGKQGEDIRLSTYNRIKSLYPSDEAIGYEANQIRGMWSIQFDK